MNASSPFVLARVAVAETARLSPAFVRITFAGEDLAQVGISGPVYDQRIKLIFPPASGELPRLASDDHDWYAGWLALPEHERGSMRTYSIRELGGGDRDSAGSDGGGDTPRISVDFVLHTSPGEPGPASAWAERARAGDEIYLLAPRAGHAAGGIEFDPSGASTLLLAGDETAVPAITRILLDLPATATGHAFIEIPDSPDIMRIDAACGVEVHWLPRGHRRYGEALIPAVLAHLGATPERAVLGDEGEELPWETPLHTTIDEPLEPSPGIGVPGGYAWIAGESRVVTTLRRHLVRELGFERHQVAFMGYWREGVAMRS